MKLILGLSIIALALAYGRQADAFKVTDCGVGKSTDAKLVSLSINSCPDETVDRCNFIRGQNATMTLQFEPTKTFSQAIVSIKGVLHGIYIPFALPGPKDACGNYGFDCPVKVGEKNQLQITIPVLRAYPTIKVAIHFEMFDESKNTILCLEFPVQLV